MPYHTQDTGINCYLQTWPRRLEFLVLISSLPSTSWVTSGLLSLDIGSSRVEGEDWSQISFQTMPILGCFLNKSMTDPGEHPKLLIGRYTYKE